MWCSLEALENRTKTPKGLSYREKAKEAVLDGEIILQWAAAKTPAPLEAAVSAGDFGFTLGEEMQQAGIECLL